MNRDDARLSTEERRLADALARMPTAEPPAELDARVHALAAAAVGREPRITRRRPRLLPLWLGTGLGTAAAAVLVVGVAWQAGFFDIEFGSSLPVPRSQGPTVPATPASDTVDVDLSLQAPSAPLPAQAPAALHEETAASAAKSLPPLPAKPTPAPPSPAATPAPPAAPATPPVEPERAATASLRARVIEQHDAPAPVPLPVETMQQGVSAEAARIEFDAPDAAVGRAAPASGATLPHWKEDAELAPTAWLERIRERVRMGDRAGAVSSLRLFHARNPSWQVPDDLVRLLAG